MTEDSQLLRRYTEERAEPAFGELVTRHIDLVYSAALRVAGGDRQLAQDVAQSVFADLARKAKSLPRDVVLAGWLYRHACFTAAKLVRAERRRRIREKTAMEMIALQANTEPTWEQIAPVLDEAMNQLSAPDRDAIVLRFLKRQDLRAVGSALGVGEDAAQKRVSRALDKLRGFLSRRGVTLMASTLATALTGEAVTAAPTGLAISVTAASLAGAGAAAGTGISATFMKLTAMTNLKAGAAGALVIAGVVTPLTIQHQSLNRMRQENLALRQQTGDITQLREANARLAKLQLDADELARLRGEHAELMRLRGEVASLRGMKDELARLQSEKQRPQGAKPDAEEFVPADKFVDAGLVTLEAAVQTLCYAAFTGNKERYRQAVDWTALIPFAYEAYGKDDPNWTPDKVWFTPAQFPGRFQGFQILSQKLVSPDEAEVEVARRLKLGTTETRETNRLKFRRIGNEWKFRMLSPADFIYFPFDETINRPEASGNPGK